MVIIASRKRLRRLLQSEQALLFIHAEWSGEAVRAEAHLSAFETMARKNHYPLSTFHKIRPWAFADAHKWIYEQPLLQFKRRGNNGLICLAHSGSLVWLRMGNPLHVERHALNLSHPELLELSASLFEW